MRAPLAGSSGKSRDSALPSLQGSPARWAGVSGGVTPTDLPGRLTLSQALSFGCPEMTFP